MMEYDSELGYYIPVDKRKHAKCCINSFALGCASWVVLLSVAYLVFHFLIGLF